MLYVKWWLEYLFRNYKVGSRWGSGFWRYVSDIFDRLEWLLIDIIDWMIEVYK